MAALQTVPVQHRKRPVTLPDTDPSQTATMTPAVNTTSPIASSWDGMRCSMKTASIAVQTGMPDLQMWKLLAS